MKALLYFVKFPQPGRVKTRLAKEIGATEAAELYRRLAEKNWTELDPLREQGIRFFVAFDPTDREKEIREWLGGEALFIPQQGFQLGERLTRAFSSVFAKGACRVIAVGSDTLGLTWDLVSRGFQELDRSDLILGPARDGGYYLIGLSRFEARIFQGIPWSTPEVLRETLARADELGCSTSLLPELEDLDQVENLEGFRRWLRPYEMDLIAKAR